jgi:hypothetical protein
VERMELLSEIGGGVNQPALPGLVVNQSLACDVVTLSSILPGPLAVGAVAAGLWDASIVSGPQQDYLDAHSGSSIGAKPEASP